MKLIALLWQKNKVLTLSAFVVLLGACSTNYCKEMKKVDPTLVGLDPEKKKPMVSQSKERVFVYKYDGSLQCGMGAEVPEEVMAKELQKIEIFSSKKRPDGMMRTQVCGSPTGMANVYEISKSDLEDAEKYGFKKWTFGE